MKITHRRNNRKPVQERDARNLSNYRSNKLVRTSRRSGRPEVKT